MYLTKKIIPAFSLLFLLAIPVIFSATILLKQKIIHYQREERMGKETLQTITLSSEKVFWIKPGKEILTDGKLFDVKSFVSAGSKVVFTGYFDDKEDILVEQIVRLTGHKNQSGSPFNQSVINFLFFPAYIGSKVFTCQATCWKTVSKQYYSFDEKIITVPEKPRFQPPCC